MAELFQQRPAGKGHDHPGAAPQDEAVYLHPQALCNGTITTKTGAALQRGSPGFVIPKEAYRFPPVFDRLSLSGSIVSGTSHDRS